MATALRSTPTSATRGTASRWGRGDGRLRGRGRHPVTRATGWLTSALGRPQAAAWAGGAPHLRSAGDGLPIRRASWRDSHRPASAGGHAPHTTPAAGGLLGAPPPPRPSGACMLRPGPSLSCAGQHDTAKGDAGGGAAHAGAGGGAARRCAGVESVSGRGGGGRDRRRPLPNTPRHLIPSTPPKHPPPNSQALPAPTPPTPIHSHPSPPPRLFPTPHPTPARARRCWWTASTP